MNDTQTIESTTGRFPGTSFDSYKSIDAINASSLRILYLNSPAHVVSGKEATTFMEFGAALHCLTLEPQQFPSRYYLHRKFNRTKKKDKADSKELEELNPGKSGVVEGDFVSMQRIADAIRAHPIAGPLVKTSTHEETLVWEEHFGLCKARPDMLGNGWATDLKSCQSAHPKDFSWNVVPTRKEYGNLWIQAAWYFRGCRALEIPVKEFHFIAVESAQPHGITVHTLEEAELQSVQDTLTALGERWRECLTKLEFPGYAPVRNVISLGDEQ